MKISDVCEINPRKRVPLQPEETISFIPMTAVSTTGRIDTSEEIAVSSVKNYSVFRENDVIFAKITPCMENGKGAIARNLKNGWAAGSTEFIVLRADKDKITPEWLRLFLSQKAFRLYCQQHMTGSAGQKRVPAKFLANCEISVPPIDEQARIVARIEELFSELDNGVQTLQTIKRQLAVYRQAVLKEAFEGKLTEEWRNTHSNPVHSDFESIKLPGQVFRDTSGDENEINLELPTAWKHIRLGEIFDVQVGATPSRRISEYWNGEINWVSSGEVHFNRIYRTKEQITHEGLNHASTNVHPIGTVMLAMIGEGKTRGQAAILNVEAAHNQNTAAILVSKTPCEPKYVYYFLQLNYDNTRRVGSGNNQKALNKERVRALRIPFTSYQEQKEIVS